MKIAICEDEAVFSGQLTEHVNDWAREKSVFVEIFTYTNAEKFLYDWEESEDYDILFLDIKMSKMSGMDLARIIRKTNEDLPIVFTTGMTEYIIQGYIVSAMQYLLKPVPKAACFDCLDRALGNIKTKKYYLLNDTDKTVKIPVTNIIYIKMFSHTATMVTLTKEHQFRKTMSQILDELNDSLFIKCQKSFIINIRHVESISKKIVVMSNDDEIPLGKDVAGEINDMFIKYNMNKV